MTKTLQELLDLKGPWASLASLSKLDPDTLPKHIITSWEKTGKVRAQVPSHRVYIYLPDFAYCLGKYTAHERIPALGRRELNSVDGTQGMSGREIQERYPVEAITSSEIETFLYRIKELLPPVHTLVEGDWAEMGEKIHSLEKRVDILMSLLRLDPYKSGIKTSPMGYVKILRKAEAFLGNKNPRTKDLEKWCGILAAIDLEDMSSIVSAVEDIGPEASKRMQRDPKGLTVFLEVAAKLCRRLDKDPRSFEIGSVEASLRRKSYLIRDELEAKTVSFAYVTRSLFYKKGLIPVGGVETEMNLINSLR